MYSKLTISSMYGKWYLLLAERLIETQYTVKNLNSKQNNELVTIR
jgi:hypothetical protein